MWLVCVLFMVSLSGSVAQTLQEVCFNTTRAYSASLGCVELADGCDGNIAPGYDGCGEGQFETNRSACVNKPGYECAMCATCARGTSKGPGCTSDACTSCPENWYADSYGARECTACPTGWVSDPGASACHSCECQMDVCGTYNEWVLEDLEIWQHDRAYAPPEPTLSPTALPTRSPTTEAPTSEPTTPSPTYRLDHEIVALVDGKFKMSDGLLLRDNSVFDFEEADSTLTRMMRPEEGPVAIGARIKYTDLDEQCLFTLYESDTSMLVVSLQNHALHVRRSKDVRTLHYGRRQLASWVECTTETNYCYKKSGQEATCDMCGDCDCNPGQYALCRRYSASSNRFKLGCHTCPSGKYNPYYAASQDKTTAIREGASGCNTPFPSTSPTASPSLYPSASPSVSPSVSPSTPTLSPTQHPTRSPTERPEHVPMFIMVEHNNVTVEWFEHMDTYTFPTSIDYNRLVVGGSMGDHCVAFRGQMRDVQVYREAWTLDQYLNDQRTEHRPYVNGTFTVSGVLNPSSGAQTLFSWSDRADTEASAEGGSLRLDEHGDIRFEMQTCEHRRRLLTKNVRVVGTGRCQHGSIITGQTLEACAHRATSTRFSYNTNTEECSVPTDDCADIVHTHDQWFLWEIN